MTAVGKRLVEKRPTQLFKAGSILLPFDHYVFESEHGFINVFFCLIDFGEKEANIFEVGTTNYSFEGPLRAVLERRRNAGQQELEVGVWGTLDPNDAEAAFNAMLNKLVVRLEGTA